MLNGEVLHRNYYWSCFANFPFSSLLSFHAFISQYNTRIRSHIFPSIWVGGCGYSPSARIGVLFWCLNIPLRYVRFDVFMAANMKNAVFWDVTPCGSCENRRFGGTYHHQHQSDKNRRAIINHSFHGSLAQTPIWPHRLCACIC
jgi:hypothetical protein